MTLTFKLHHCGEQLLSRSGFNTLLPGIRCKCRLATPRQIRSIRCLARRAHRSPPRISSQLGAIPTQEGGENLWNIRSPKSSWSRMQSPQSKGWRRARESTTTRSTAPRSLPIRPMNNVDARALNGAKRSGSACLLLINLQEEPLRSRFAGIANHSSDHIEVPSMRSGLLFPATRMRTNPRFPEAM